MGALTKSVDTGVSAAGTVGDNTFSVNALERFLKHQLGGNAGFLALPSGKLGAVVGQSECKTSQITVVFCPV